MSEHDEHALLKLTSRRASELYGNPAIRDALLIAHPRTGGFASPSFNGYALVDGDECAALLSS
jgi:hypothetical protein